MVAAFADLGEADIAQAKLRAYGIEAVLVDHAEGGALAAGDGARVGIEVRAADAADAVAILQPAEEPSGD